jgi:drug/metabolite transporter (DMT)-like permease
MSAPVEVPVVQDATASSGALGPRPWLAVALMAAAMLCFTTLDSVMKTLHTEHPLSMLVMVRNLVQVVALGLLVPAIGGEGVRTKRYGLHFLRGACMVLSTIFITLSLGHLSLAQTYSITFSTPLMATLIAALALGERPSLTQWACIAIGFGGVLLVVDPQHAAAGPALLFPLAMAFFNAVLYVLTRYGGLKESPVTLVFWGSLGALLICLCGLPFYAAWLPIEAYLLLVAGGLAGTAGHLMMAAAFRRAPTAVIAPLLYTQIVWATLIGWFFFQEVPPANAVIGGAVVVASGIGVLRLVGR